MRFLLTLLALLLPGVALAQNQVALTSNVLVERIVTDGSFRLENEIEQLRGKKN